MEPNHQTILTKKVTRMVSQTVPIVKKIKYNPGFTSLVKEVPSQPPKKLLSSPIKNPRIVNLRTPKQPVKSPVHVNLMKRFNHLSNAAKENIQYENGMQIVNLSDQSNLIIKVLDASPVKTKNHATGATLEALIKRGISVTPSNSNSTVVQNGHFIKLGSEVTIKPISPAIEKWFKCSNCPGYFVTNMDLVNHENEYHQQKTHDFGLPVVDLSKDETRDKLISLGIKHYLIITDMNQTEGCSSFGIPIVSVQGSANSTLCNILAMGADGILSLGSFKEIHK